MFLALDTEDDSRGNVKVIDFFDGMKHYTFNEKAAAKRYINKLCQIEKVWIIGCNIQYDIWNIWNIDEVECMFVGGRFISAKLRNRQRYTAQFLDTLNIVKKSVAELGEHVKLTKFKMPDRSSSSKKLIKYCQRDSEIVWVFYNEFYQFISKYTRKIKPTLSGYSYELFISKFSDRHYMNFQKYDELLRKSFFGARTECFKIGFIKRRLFYHDINSMYPAIMKHAILPDWEKVEFVKHPGLDDVYNLEGVISCEVSSDLELPVLPLRINGQIFFPNGIFSGVWTMPEIRFFRQQGGIITKIKWIIGTQKTVKGLFNKYVDHFYKKKKMAKNDVDRLIAKGLLNSLWGKFAFRGEVERLVSIEGGEYGGRLAETKELMGFVKKEVRTKYSNIMISSYITAYGRMILYKYMKEAGKDLIYADTDSVITTKRFCGNNDILGKMSLKSVWSKGTFMLPKLYFLEKERKYKMSAKGFRIKSKNDIMELLKTGKFKYEEPTKIRNALRGQKINVWNKKEKTIRTQYNRRVVLKNGSTRPIYYIQPHKVRL